MCEDCKKEKCECEIQDKEITVNLGMLTKDLDKYGADKIEACFTFLGFEGREFYYGVRKSREDE